MPRSSPAGRADRRAFTLIEMLAVLAVIALVLGMTIPGFNRDERDALVHASADELASTLRKARSLAMARQAAYGVAFNIQNDPDSSGRVLNNRSGGHWYQIIGPSGNSTYDPQGGTLPTAGDMGADALVKYHNLPNFPDFTLEVSHCWVGDRIVLPRKRVRFLALSDTDEGPRVRAQHYNDSGDSPLNVWYGVGGERSYPRPWCGYWDRTTGEWWPWGGRGATTTAVATKSAFWYQGREADFADSRSPADRAYTQYFDLNGDKYVSGAGETVPGYQVLTTGEPRPLVNAAWLDAVIVFLPSGQAIFLEWNRARRYYDTVQAVPDNNANEAFGFRSNGVRDMAKSQGSATYTNASYDQAEVTHFTRHTGGWFITLGPDTADDRHTFASPADVISTITPAYRVFVGTWGSVRTIRVRNQPLTGRKLWPPAPDDWLSSASTGVWRNCRNGWLHVAATSTSNSVTTPVYKLKPRGIPVIDMINEQILADRAWWIDEAP
jgi:prepilin-type N-terminal cleavage/methylation domain-containing protein